MICDECETVVHCTKNGCIPKIKCNKPTPADKQLGWRKRQVMEMAREAGWDAHNAEFDTRIEAFAELVRAEEREACAKVCETHAPITTPTWVSYAAAIRARGQV